MIPTLARSTASQWILCSLLVVMLAGWFTIRRVSLRERQRRREKNDRD